MKKLSFAKSLVVAAAAAAAAGCAVRPVPDPRAPGAVRDAAVVLRVCYVEGDGAHLAVGDQVELTTNQLGRLRIRHLPGADNRDGVWNGGDDVRVRSAVLVERLDARGAKTNVRAFVPVGRFSVGLGDARPHAKFDFLESKATANLSNNKFPECNVDLGDDEVLVRGVTDDERHGGGAHLR